MDENPSIHVTVIRGAEGILGRELLIREDGSVTGSISPEWSEKILELADNAFTNGQSQRVVLDEETEVFMEYISPLLTLVVVGGVHIAKALVSIAKTLDYQTILIDPRKAWGSVERFPNVNQLIQSWPDDAFSQIKITRSTAIVMLTHDPKIDDPASKIALNSSAFYVGALGSKTTNAKRHERLLNDGVSELQLSRLHAPIGLDIGAQSPEEIALAIMAEAVNAHRKRNQVEAKKEAEPVSSP